MPALPSLENIAVNCSACPAETVVEGIPVDPVSPGYDAIQRNRDLWDAMAPAITARDWAIQSDARGGRFALCPACAQRHQPGHVAELPAFDPRAKCPKCGHSRVAMRWCDGRSPGCAAGVRDHLHRACGRCGYSWASATKYSATASNSTPPAEAAEG